MSIGERMLSYRAKHGLSQRQLADKLDESFYMIRNCEHNWYKLQKANEIRISQKMAKLENEDMEVK